MNVTETCQRKGNDIIQKLKYISGHTICRPIFILGTGRSGTHWLGHALQNHPEIRATIESRPMFGWSVTMALNPETENVLLKRLVRAYKWQIFKSAPRHYLDKSHPNIWIAEKLQSEFPKALFIGIERNPYATVASMMRHGGVASWHRRWRQFPIPNRFLGIDMEMAPRYDQLPRAAQCAIRWLSHHNRMTELRKSLRKRLMVIRYERLAHDTQAEIIRLQRFLCLTNPIPMPYVKTESLHKWRNQLSRDEITQISSILGFTPTEYMNGIPKACR